MTNQSIYTVGGTVQAGGGVYIKRKADDELLQHCRAAEFAFILSSRQVGKSSLMVRTAQQLEQEGIRSVIIDLNSIGVKISADEWYLGILNEIANTLKLKTDIFAWWSERASLSPASRMINFFRDVLLMEVNQPIVLFFDEIDSTLSIPFADDFFAALRSIYNARSTVEDFKRLSFTMVGVATPSDLITDSKRTPFNIGHRVELSDFTLEEAAPLAGNLGTQSLGWALDWTGGHPYLTQLLCAYLSKSKASLTKDAVAGAVEQLFEGDQGKSDNNLQFVRDMLTKRSPDRPRVLKTYRDIRMGKKVADDERSVAKSHLKISGVVRSENGILLLRNQIYKTVFNASWAQENIPQNRAKIVAVSFAVITFTLLAVLIYDFVVGSLSSQYAGNFYTSRSGPEKLKNLASLFELKGILQNTDFDYRARELFYSLNWNEQMDLFTDPNIAPEDKQKYLPEIVNGLYVTMANIEGQQDSSDLLNIMLGSLKDVKTSGSLFLQNEIGLWLEARSALTDQDAFDKYNETIQLNNNNPATHYERALIELRIGLYEEALLDLDTTMGLAQNLSSEESESEIITPTPWISKTQTPNSNSPILVTPRTSIPTIEVTETPFTVTQVAVVVTPTAVSSYIPRERYRSSFYSIAYIRSAIDLVLKGYARNEDFQFIVYRNYNELVNLRNSGLLETPSCSVAYPSRLQEGKDATVCTSVDRIIVRARPGLSAPELLSLYPGTTMHILEGPVCADDFWWWKVEIYPGTTYGLQANGYDPLGTTDKTYLGWAREGWDDVDKYFICQ